MSQHGPAQLISAASEYLRDLARRIAAAYVARTPARAAVLVGSASTGESDEYSDIDLGILYDALPADKELDAARAAVIRELEALVTETVALVEQHMPDIDVADAKRFLGERHVRRRLPSRS
jgi:predicted nucleotidyltransferase